MQSERSLIAELSRIFGQPPDGVVCGIGDDTAVIAPDRDYCLLWTIDALVEGVHFELGYTPLKKLGKKALAVNLSDIAAMGGEPLYALLSLGWPPERDLAGALELAQGMQEVAYKYHTALIGGDTVSSPGSLTMSLTVLGRVTSAEVLRRDGARVGDLIYVTGPLGEAAAGLGILRSGLEVPEAIKLPLLEAFLEPQPRITAGRLLAESQLATAAIDLSDGVATDLQQLCLMSRVGAVVEADQIPVSAAVIQVAALLGKAPLDLALKGGEDYQLLFTASPDLTNAIRDRFRLADLPLPACIGRITAGSGVLVRSAAGDQEISGTGYDHFQIASS